MSLATVKKISLLMLDHFPTKLLLLTWIYAQRILFCKAQHFGKNNNNVKGSSEKLTYQVWR